VSAHVPRFEEDGEVTSLSSPPTSWHLSGSYFEACNCDAICPCRTVGSRPGGRSTYGICQFALSWHITEGRADDVILSDLDVVMAGWYDDDEPGSPWRISLYIGDDANDAQYGSLTSIFLGRAGGTALENFASAIGTVHEVRRARIRLSHVPRRWFIRAATFVSVSAKVPVEASAPVACGIPGLDRPGQEVVADELRVNDTPLVWDLHERCGFATDFEYQGAGGVPGDKLNTARWP
jgi:hypothetical protein